MLAEKIDANQHIRRTQEELGLADGDRLPFLCECDDPACRTLVRLTSREYDAARAVGDRCIVSPAHPYRGRVVVDGDGYAVVEE